MTDLILGVTGQSGSILADQLLEDGVEVVGVARRVSVDRLQNLSSALTHPLFTLVEGDVTDPGCLARLLSHYCPRHVYNLAAQSHVATSFGQPRLTTDIVYGGVLNLLEAVRSLPPSSRPRVYQASSSEMFGSSISYLEPFGPDFNLRRVDLTAPTENDWRRALKTGASPFQDELTSFAPNSPYAVSKLAAHNLCRVYRESYGIFVSCGILFNHECLTSRTPVVVRRKGVVDVLPMEDLVPHRTSPKHSKVYTSAPEGLEVWDKDRFVRVTCATATWNQSGSVDDKKVHAVNCRGGYYEATADHISFLDGGVETPTSELSSGQSLQLGKLPDLPESTAVSDEEAELLGMLVADGYFCEDGHGRFTKVSKRLRSRAAELWCRVTGGSYRHGVTSSGFSDAKIPIIEFTGGAAYGRWLHEQIYTRRSHDKRIPLRILNAPRRTIEIFLRAYNVCDGLKEGKQQSEFKSFTTASPTLACGLWWLASMVVGVRMTSHPERRGEFLYHHLNLNSPNPGWRGANLRKPLQEIKSVTPLEYTGWLFDFETESGTFSAGVGLTWVHNSPRRSPQFVTRKVTSYVASVVRAKRESTPLPSLLILGNLESRRDWGYAPDYTRGMRLMLEHDEPGDFVLATGETHTVRELCQEAFGLFGLDYLDFVQSSPSLLRPCEVSYLRGLPNKAYAELGWRPSVHFEELVRRMVYADLEPGCDLAGHSPESRPCGNRT